MDLSKTFRQGWQLAAFQLFFQDTVVSENLRHLPDFFKTIPIMSVRCVLEGCEVPSVLASSFRVLKPSSVIVANH